MRSLRKGTPGEGGGQRPDSFSYTPVTAGLKNSWSGFIAGETYWCDEAHEHKPPFLIGSKPCLHWMTGGEVKCERCRKQPAVMKLGWVPMWRETDHAPVIVIVHQDALDLVSGLRYGQAVVVGRVTETTTVYVRASEAGVWFKTDNPFRKRAVDITKDLLAMWQIPALNEWLKSQPPQPPAPVHTTEPTQASEENGRPRGPIARLRAANEREQRAREKDVRRIVKTAADVFGAPPSANGKHHDEQEGN